MPEKQPCNNNHLKKLGICGDLFGIWLELRMSLFIFYLLDSCISVAITHSYQPQTWYYSHGSKYVPPKIRQGKQSTMIRPFYNYYVCSGYSSSRQMLAFCAFCLELSVCTFIIRTYKWRLCLHLIQGRAHSAYNYECMWSVCNPIANYLDIYS